MAEENNTALKIPVKPPIGGLKKGILANKANFDKQIAEVDPLKVPNRLGLVIDDSGSMGTDGMKNAHDAVKNFTASCSMLDTSIAVYPLNKESKHLVINYDLVNLYVSGLGPTGSTPVYAILDKLISNEPITRAVLFSDGSPTDASLLAASIQSDSFWGTKSSGPAMACITKYKEKEIPIDTIFIGDALSSGYKEMQKIAELTGGTFIHFKDSLSLSSGLKYLAPKYRALLANPEIKARIERGENV